MNPTKKSADNMQSAKEGVPSPGNAGFIPDHDLVDVLLLMLRYWKGFAVISIVTFAGAWAWFTFFPTAPDSIATAEIHLSDSVAYDQYSPQAVEALRSAVYGPEADNVTASRQRELLMAAVEYHKLFDGVWRLTVRSRDADEARSILHAAVDQLKTTWLSDTEMRVAQMQLETSEHYLQNIVIYLNLLGHITTQPGSGDDLFSRVSPDVLLDKIETAFRLVQKDYAATQRMISRVPDGKFIEPIRVSHSAPLNPTKHALFFVFFAAMINAVIVLSRSRLSGR